MRTLNNGIYVDGETGEVIPVQANSVIRSEEERKKVRQVLESKQELVRFKGDTCGDFFWSLYKVGEEYYPEVSDSMLVKVIYLLSYLDYEKNILVTRENASEPYRPMTRKDVEKVIRLHRCKFPRFWKELMETGIIQEQEDGSLLVCEKFCRGHLSKKDREGMAAMKLFTHCVRYLYENIEVRGHKYLSYLYRLMPFINLKYNVFCSNPLENDRMKLCWLTTKEMCEILGYSEGNEKRLIQTLFKLSFEDRNGDLRSVITMISNTKNGEMRHFITINPQFYAGYISQEDMQAINFKFSLDKV